MGGARAEGAISFGGVGGPSRSGDKNVAREEKVELTCADGGGVEVDLEEEAAGADSVVGDVAKEAGVKGGVAAASAIRRHLWTG